MRHVLFDLDGTLIDSKRLYLECYRRAVEPFVRREFTLDDLRRLKPRSERALLEAVVGPDRLEECTEAFHREYAAGYGAFFDGIYDGVPQLLERLRTAGRRLGIVTGKSRRSWQVTAAREELGPFDVLVFDDDVPAPEPSPAGILLALQALEVDPEDAIYVGDTMGDVLAGREAGTHTAAVLWSRGGDVSEFEERSREAGAIPVRRPADLVHLLT